MATRSMEFSPVRYARIAGVLYLLIILFAGSGEVLIRGNMIVAGDAAATAGNILKSEGVFRLVLTANLIAFLCDIGVGVILYMLLKPVSQVLALAAVFLRLAQTAVLGLNTLNYTTVLLLLSGADYLHVFSADQLNALVLVFLEGHRNGYLISQVFFGVHCLVLGYLLYRSELFPSIFGVFMAIASVGYLTEVFGTFLAPAHEDVYAYVVAIPAVIAEFSFTIWLLVKGARTPT